MKSKDRSVAGLIIKNRTPDEKPEEMQEDSSDMAMKECASTLIEAVHSKNIPGVIQSLKDAFELMEQSPHVEGPHINEEEV